MEAGAQQLENETSWIMDWPVVGRLGLPDGVRWDQIRSSDGREGDAEEGFSLFFFFFHIYCSFLFLFLWQNGVYSGVKSAVLVDGPMGFVMGWMRGFEE